jgi:hypothetical protein
MNIQFDMVIHGEFGGFSLTDEIVDRLKKRSSPVVEKFGRPSPSSPWYPLADEDEVRRDPDLIAVVRELTEEIDRIVDEDASWRDRSILEQRYLHGLKVVTVFVEIEIEDHDGKETVRVFGGAT